MGSTGGGVGGTVEGAGWAGGVCSDCGGGVATGSSIGASAIGAGDSSGGLAACGLFPAELDLAFTGSFVGGQPGLHVGGVTTSMLSLTLTSQVLTVNGTLKNHCTINN